MEFETSRFNFMRRGPARKINHPDEAGLRLMSVFSQVEQADGLLTFQAQFERLTPIDEKKEQVGTFLGDRTRQGTPAQARLIQPARIQNTKSAPSA